MKVIGQQTNEILKFKKKRLEEKKEYKELSTEKVRCLLLKTEDLKTNCPLGEEVIGNLWPEHLMRCTGRRFPQDQWKTIQEKRIFDQTREEIQ